MTADAVPNNRHFANPISTLAHGSHHVVFASIVVFSSSSGAAPFACAIPAPASVLPLGRRRCGLRRSIVNCRHLQRALWHYFFNFFISDEFEIGRLTSPGSSSLLLPIYAGGVPTRSASMPPVSSKVCFYEPSVAASIARIARCVIKPFLVCPYHNAALRRRPALGSRYSICHPDNGQGIQCTLSPPSLTRAFRIGSTHTRDYFNATSH